MTTQQTPQQPNQPTQNQLTHGNAPMFIWILFAAFAITMLVLILNHNYGNKNSGSNNFNGTEYLVTEKYVFIPSDTTYVLTKGDTIRQIPIPDGLKVDLYSGATVEKPHKYSHRFQNGEWEIWGDGSNHGVTFADFFELAGYEDKVEVTCRYTKK
jgi:hypothetical protein